MKIGASGVDGKSSGCGSLGVQGWISRIYVGARR